MMKDLIISELMKKYLSLYPTAEVYQNIVEVPEFDLTAGGQDFTVSLGNLPNGTKARIITKVYTNRKQVAALDIFKRYKDDMIYFVVNDKTVYKDYIDRNIAEAGEDWPGVANYKDNDDLNDLDRPVPFEAGQTVKFGFKAGAVMAKAGKMRAKLVCYDVVEPNS